MMALDDRKLGVLALVLAAFLAWHGHTLEAAFSYEPIGPRAFPLAISVIIALCGLILTIKGGNRVEPNSSGANARLWLMIAILSGYAVTFQLLGFILSTALMTTLVARLFNGTWTKAVIGGLGMGVLFFILFDRLLDVVLPVGILGAFL
jgi:putative tricarboxylic transport membrane protein